MAGRAPEGVGVRISTAPEAFADLLLLFVSELREELANDLPVSFQVPDPDLSVSLCFFVTITCDPVV